MKKIILSIILCLGLSSVFMVQADAKLKDSPTKGYLTYLSNGKVIAYTKPNGKKIEVIPTVFNATKKPYIPYDNQVKIVKFTNEKWVKVKYGTKHNSSKNTVTRNKTGYIKVKHLFPNMNSADYAIVNVNVLNLRSKPNTKSKVVKKISLGTRLSFDYSKGYPFKYLNTKKNTGWVKVKYIKNGKKYSGYVNYKYVN